MSVLFDHKNENNNKLVSFKYVCYDIIYFCNIKSIVIKSEINFTINHNVDIGIALLYEHSTKR